MEVIARREIDGAAQWWQQREEDRKKETGQGRWLGSSSPWWDAVGEIMEAHVRRLSTGMARAAAMS